MEQEKNVFIILGILLFLLSFCSLLYSEEASSTAQSSSSKDSLAVLPFDSKGGIRPDTCGILSDIFISALLETNKFKIMNRGEIKKILDEQKFAKSDYCSNKDSAVEAGKILSVENIITGSVALLGNSYIIIINMIDVETSEYKKVLRESFVGTEDKFFNILPNLARKIAGLEGEYVAHKPNTQVIITQTQTPLPIKTESIQIASKEKSPTSIEAEQNPEIKPLPKKNFIETFGGLNLEMVYIKADSFLMGNNNGDNDEKPVHSVNLPDFWIGKYEITVAQFKKFIEDTGFLSKAEMRNDRFTWKNPGYEQPTDNYPVTCITWEDAQKFCDWLSGNTGRIYTFPSEAMWEYACKAGSDTKFFWGDNEIMGKGYLNCRDQTARIAYKDFAKDWKFFNFNDSYLHASPVGSFKPNRFGLYDMLGNVWEWCQDWYHPNYNEAPCDGRAWENVKGEFRVIRGGSYNESYENVYSSYRGKLNNISRNNIIGFRICCLR